MTTKDLTIAATAVKLIIEQEGLSQADWPDGASGVTIGRGYDLGYHTVEELLNDWGGRLPVGVIDTLTKCCGVTGTKALALIREIAGDPKAKSIPGVRISRELADEVFLSVDVPRWIQRAAKTFPGYDLLPDEIQGTLVSLVFNRGTRMSDNDKRLEERREMRAIRRAILQWSAQPDAQVRTKLFPQLLSIAARELRAMKRLWEGKNLGGLLRRREAEAQLVEKAVLR